MSMNSAINMFLQPTLLLDSLFSNSDMQTLQIGSSQPVGASLADLYTQMVPILANGQFVVAEVVFTATNLVGDGLTVQLNVNGSVMGESLEADWQGDSNQAMVWRVIILNDNGTLKILNTLTFGDDSADLSQVKYYYETAYGGAAIFLEFLASDATAGAIAKWFTCGTSTNTPTPNASLPSPGLFYTENISGPWPLEWQNDTFTWNWSGLVPDHWSIQQSLDGGSTWNQIQTITGATLTWVNSGAGNELQGLIRVVGQNVSNVNITGISNSVSLGIFPAVLRYSGGNVQWVLNGLTATNWQIQTSTDNATWSNYSSPTTATSIAGTTIGLGIYVRVIPLNGSGQPLTNPTNSVKTT
jgi:hypothetical protein